MNSCPPLDRLEQLLAESPGRPGDAALEQHVEACAVCQGLLAALASDAATARWCRLQARWKEVTSAAGVFLDQLADTPPVGAGAESGQPQAWVDTVPASPLIPDSRSAEPVVPEPGLPAVPGYEVLRELGRGGMGVVYQARHVRLKRLVALKIVSADSLASADTLARFQAEAEAVALLEHPQIVRVFDYGACDLGTGRPCPYLALEFVDGGTLQQQLEAGPFGGRAAAQLLALLAQAVEFAHQRGILHRDLKPANVLVTADGTPKLTDFGLAKRVDRDSDLTQTGRVVGTPSYMAPEQTLGRSRTLTTLVDVYGLGALLYELLTGHPPFVGESALDTLLRVRHEPPTPPRRLNPQIDRDLETMCLKCLAKEPADRYPSARALAEDLQHWLAGEPISARPPAALTLLRLGLKQNFGAAGWTLVLGLGYGLVGAWQMFLAGPRSVLTYRGQAYQALPSLARPWWSLSTHWPPWLVPVSFVLVFLVTCSAGLLTWLIVRPRNRFAEIATGLLTGTTAGLVLFAVSGAWYYSVCLAYRPANRDLWLLQESAKARAASGTSLAPEADPVVQAYPDLREHSEAERTHVLLVKFYGDSCSRLPLAILVALFMSLFVCEAVVLSGVLAAGHVLRGQEWHRRALLPYYGLAAPAALLWGYLFNLVLELTAGHGRWADHLGLTFGLVAALGAVLVAQLRSWPRWLVVLLHLTWIAGVVVRVAVSVR